MMWKPLLVVVAVYSSTTISSPVINGKDVGEVKSNGAVINSGQFGYVVFLEIATNKDGILYWNCGGTIIKLDVILTAGHCLEVGLEITDIVAWAGIVDRSLEEKKGQRIKGVQYRVHDHFGGTENPEDLRFLHNDIALIWLEKSFIPGPKVKVANWKNQKTFVREEGSVVGWGYTNNCEMSNMLKTTKLFVLSDEKCYAYYTKESFSGKTFCAIALDKKSGANDGDSGGPFIFQNTVVGIISFVGKITIDYPNNGDKKMETSPKVPTVMTEIYKYRTWILDKLKSGKKDKQNVRVSCRKHCSRESSASRNSVKIFEKQMKRKCCTIL